jgi:hypothetical protein
VRGNEVGTENPFFITRLKYFSSWLSVGLDGSTRRIDVEGCYIPVSTERNAGLKINLLVDKF